MKVKSIILGNIYYMTLGRNEVLGEVIAETETGWQVRLTASDKVIKVNSPDRFLRKARVVATTQDESNEVTDATPAAKTPQNENVEAKREGLSGLDAAHLVLVEIGKPLNARQIAEAILERGYCPNLKGKTPQATISSSMQREITRLGDESRFYKTGKGQFAAVECRQK